MFEDFSFPPRGGGGVNVKLKVMLAGRGETLEDRLRIKHRECRQDGVEAAA